MADFGDSIHFCGYLRLLLQRTGALSCNHSDAVIPSGVNGDPLESPGASRHIYSFLTCLLDAFYFIYVCVYIYIYVVGLFTHRKIN